MADIELSKKDETEVVRFLAWIEENGLTEDDLREKFDIGAAIIESMKYKRRRVSDSIKLRMAKLYGLEYMQSVIESELVNA